MKKLVVLILFMFMASVATAGLQALTVTGPTNSTEPGAPVDILVGQYTTVNIVVSTTYGPFDAQDWVIDVSAEGLLGIGVVNPLETPPSVILNNGTAAPFGMPAGQWGVTMAPGAGMLVAGDVLVSFTVTGVTIGTVTITLYDLSGGMLVEDVATVNVVPEPMTMALLGLGGLFLRRRKK